MVGYSSVVGDERQAPLIAWFSVRCPVQSRERRRVRSVDYQDIVGNVMQ